MKVGFSRTQLLCALLLSGALVLGVAMTRPVTASPWPQAASAKQNEKGKEAANETADNPFSLANKVTDEAGEGALKASGSDQTTANQLKNDAEDRMDFQVTYKPQRVRRGEVVKLTITAMPKPGFHTYPATKLSADPAQDGFASKVIYPDIPGLKPLWPLTENPEPEFVHEKDLGWFLQYKEPFSWSQDILVLPDAKAGLLMLPIKLNLTVCDDKGCIPATPEFEAKLEISDQPPVPLSEALQQRLKLAEPEVQRIAVPGTGVRANAKNGAAAAPATIGENKGKNQPNKQEMPKSEKPFDAARGFIAFVLLGVGWGALSLLTPCVFPMIPITVSYFLKQSEKEHHNPLIMALVYSGTIVAVLTAGGLLLLGSLQQVGQHWATNFVLGALFVVFALSLFGMFELTVPSFLVNLTSSKESQGGLVGTMFMALTFTLISFACVAPFYGGFIGFTAAAQTATDWVKLFLGALAFSLTFAAPFFLLALFPSLLRSLPKSGSWMNTVKVVMGFLELAAALKFLRAFELNFFAKAELLTYDLVLGIYVALALLCGLYLLNLYRLPHDDAPAEHVGVPRFLFSMIFLSIGFYLMPGLFKVGTGEQQRPSGPIFAWVDSFLLPDVADEAEETAAPSGKTDGRLSWVGDLDKGLKKAQEQKNLVFLDFTGLT